MQGRSGAHFRLHQRARLLARFSHAVAPCAGAYGSQNRSIVKVLQAQPDSDKDFLVAAVLKDDLDVAAVRHARGCRDALRIDACSYEGLPDRVGALLRQRAIRS